MTRKKKAILITACIFLVIVLAVSIWVAFDNSRVETSKYTIGSEDLPSSFDKFRIAQVSDLHNAEFGYQNEKLLSALHQSDPDIIALTGDIIDCKKTNVDIALNFVNEALKIAPCYYVTGNHESNLADEKYLEFENALIELGVIVLRNKAISIEIGGKTINLIGIDDPAFTGKVPNAEFINELCQEDGFNILLSHRPEYFEEYAMSDADLVLSGHAHGGQFRLPLIGGLIAPGQGLFPKHDAGVYTSSGTSMVVSRGIGNSIIPIRFNNTPELVLIVLECE